MEDKFKVFKPTANMQFEFTDLIFGYVSGFNQEERNFVLTTSDNRSFKVYLTDTTFARLINPPV